MVDTNASFTIHSIFVNFVPLCLAYSISHWILQTKHEFNCWFPFWMFSFFSLYHLATYIHSFRYLDSIEIEQILIRFFCLFLEHSSESENRWQEIYFPVSANMNVYNHSSFNSHVRKSFFCWNSSSIKIDLWIFECNNPKWAIKSLSLLISNCHSVFFN